MPQPAQRVGTAGRGEERQFVALVLAVSCGRHGIPLVGDGVIIRLPALFGRPPWRRGVALVSDGVVMARVRLALLGRRHVQKLAALEMRGEQGLDLPAERGVLAASLVQISGPGGFVGQIEGGLKGLFFGHGGDLRTWSRGQAQPQCEIRAKTRPRFVRIFPRPPRPRGGARRGRTPSGGPPSAPTAPAPRRRRGGSARRSTAV